ncbi:hypothetical protein ACFX1Q_034952 [Malus domestica]
MECIVLSYFDNLFQTSQVVDDEKIIGALDLLVTDEMAASLNEDFFETEIKATLFDMHPSKSLGSDGFFPLLFHKYWDIVRKDISLAIKYFLSSGKMLKKINFTHVALIPKQSNPTEMHHFHPIILCNVVYKIASKVLTNRMKALMPELISLN